MEYNARPTLYERFRRAVVKPVAKAMVLSTLVFGGLASNNYAKADDTLRVSTLASGSTGGGSSYLQHSDGAQEGSDIQDALWSDAPANPNNQWIMPATSPYGQNLQVDSRPTNSVTKYTINFKAVDQTNPTGTITTTTNRTRLMFDIFNSEKAYVASYTLSSQFNQSGQERITYTNANDGATVFINNPGWVNFTNGSTGAIMEVSEPYKNQAVTVGNNGSRLLDILGGTNAVTGTKLRLDNTNNISGSVALNTGQTNVTYTIGSQILDGSTNFLVYSILGPNNEELANNMTFRVNTTNTVQQVTSSPFSITGNRTMANVPFELGAQNATGSYVLSQPANANVSLSGPTNGTVSFTGLGVSAGSIVYTNSASVATNDFTVTSTNVPPSIDQIVNVSGSRGQTLQRTAAPSDSESASVTTILVNPIPGGVSVLNNVITDTGSAFAGAPGTNTILYAAEDSDGGVSGTKSFQTSWTNQNPTITASTNFLARGVSKQITPGVTDPENDAYNLLITAGNGNASVVNGTNLLFNGSNTPGTNDYSVKAVDTYTGNSSSVLERFVTTNGTFSITGMTNFLARGASITRTPIVNDADAALGDTYSLLGSGLTIQNGTNILFTAPSIPGTNDITVTANGSYGKTAGANTRWIATNAPAVITGITNSVPRGSQTIFTPIVSDANSSLGDTYNLSVNPAGAGLSVTNGTNLVFNAPSTPSTNNFTVTATDNYGDGTSASVRLISTNQAPSSANVNGTFAKHQNATFTVSASDPDTTDNPSLERILTGNTSGAGFNGSTLSVTNLAGTSGNVIKNFKIRDQFGAESSGYTANINFTNTAPTINTTNYSGSKTQNATNNVTMNDANGESTTLHVVGSDPRVTVSGSSIIVNPQNTSGTINVSAYATDSEGLSSATNVISHQFGNSVPTLLTASGSYTNHTTVNVALSASDADPEDTLEARLVNPVSGVSVNGLNVTYSPGNITANTSASVFLTDGVANSQTNTYNFAVTNTIPSVTNSTTSIFEDAPTTIVFKSGDKDGDTLTNIVDSVVNGTVTGNIFRPNTNFYGPGKVIWHSTDGQDSISATNAYTVKSVNDAPVAYPATLTVSRNASGVINLTGFDVETGTNLTYRIVSSPSNGTLTPLNTKTNSLRYQPTNNYSGPVTFDFQALDSSKLTSATQTANITVSETNNAPQILSNPTVYVGAGTTMSIDLRSFSYPHIFDEDSQQANSHSNYVYNVSQPGVGYSVTGVSPNINIVSAKSNTTNHQPTAINVQIVDGDHTLSWQIGVDKAPIKTHYGLVLGKNDTNFNSSGYITMKTSNGKVSGKAYLNGTVASVSGKWNPHQELHLTNTTLGKYGFNDLTPLYINLTNQDSSWNTFTGNIQGPAFESTFKTEANTWTTNNQPTAFTNKYTWVGLNNNSNKLGFTVGTVYVDKLGKTRVTGYTQDGQAMGFTSILSTNGNVNVFYNLYPAPRVYTNIYNNVTATNKAYREGGVLGQFNITNHNLQGWMLHTKPSTLSVTNKAAYPNIEGFENMNQIAGGKYNFVKGQRIISDENTDLIINGAGVNNTYNFNIATNNAIKITPTTNQFNPKASVSSSTGLGNITFDFDNNPLTKISYGKFNLIQNPVELIENGTNNLIFGAGSYRSTNTVTGNLESGEIIIKKK